MTVYFAAGDGRIKIGTTSGDVEYRIRAIGSALTEPLKLIGSMEGGLPLERAIQRHLLSFRLRGEWFQDCDAVRTVIRDLISRGPSVIGYRGPLTQSDKPKIVRSNHPPDPKKFGLVAKIIWPETAVAELIAISEADEETVQQWLSGEKAPPLIVRLAFGAVLMMYLNLEDDEPGPSFLKRAA